MNLLNNDNVLNNEFNADIMCDSIPVPFESDKDIQGLAVVASRMGVDTFQTVGEWKDAFSVMAEFSNTKIVNPKRSS